MQGRITGQKEELGSTLANTLLTYIQVADAYYFQLETAMIFVLAH